MMYPHKRYKNIEIATVNLDKKVISLIVHYDGNEEDLMQDEVQAQLTADVNEAIEHFKSQRYFEDDDLSGWRYPSCVMVHPPVNHE